MVKKRLRPGTDVGYVSDEVRRVSECPIYGAGGGTKMQKRCKRKWKNNIHLFFFFIIYPANPDNMGESAREPSCVVPPPVRPRSLAATSAKL